MPVLSTAGTESHLISPLFPFLPGSKESKKRLRRRTRKDPQNPAHHNASGKDGININCSVRRSLYVQQKRGWSVQAHSMTRPYMTHPSVCPSLVVLLRHRQEEANLTSISGMVKGAMMIEALKTEGIEGEGRKEGEGFHIFHI